MATDNWIRFGPFRMDGRTLELWRGDVRVPLEPLPARILGRLAAEPGVMVTRGELLELGWPRLPEAAEQSLNTCIHQIRQALGSDGPSGVELETLRGRGYRLAVPGAARAVVETPRRIHRRTWLAATLTAVMLSAGAVVMTMRAGSHVDPAEAEQALTRARYLAEETGNLPAARAVLDSALLRFPRVASLRAEWATIHLWQGDLESAREGARQALTLDSDLAATRRVLAWLALLRSDWAAADAEFERALRIDPRDTRTLAALAYRRVIEGRFDTADDFMREALRIDPLSTAVHQDAGLIYLLAGRYAEAERYCRETIRFKPESLWATDCLFDVMVLTGRTGDAAEWGRSLLELYDVATPPADAPADRVVAATEAWRLDAWRRAVGRGADPFGLALAYTANGRADEAIGALQAAIATPTLGLLGMAVDPRLAPLREHRRFQNLLDHLKLRAATAASSQRS